jgi:hypothetical protein
VGKRGIRGSGGKYGFDRRRFIPNRESKCGEKFMILFDISPIPAGVGVGLAAVFFLVFAVVAFVAFKMLKRTVKMAVRMTIAAIILVIALIGGVSLLYFGAGTGSGKPPIQQKR